MCVAVTFEAPSHHSLTRPIVKQFQSQSSQLCLAIAGGREANFMQLVESTVRSFDGTEIWVRRYIPAPDREVGNRTLVIVHGLSEHSQRYDHVARELASLNWNVLIADLRGHGKSGGPRTHVDDFQEYLGDLEILFDAFQLQPQTTAVLGHSTGALIAIRFLQEHPDRAVMAVLLSPLLGVNVEIHPLTIMLGRCLSVVLPRTRFRSRVDPADTTRNLQMIEARQNDPMVHGSVTARWYFRMLNAISLAWQKADQLSLPIILLQGKCDRIVDPDVVQPWLEQVSSEDKTLVMLPEHYHELHHEPDWQQTIHNIAEWLEFRLSETTQQTFTTNLATK